MKKILKHFSEWLERLMETWSVVYYLHTFAYRSLLSIPILVYLCFTKYYYLTLLYLVWYIYDFQTPFRGGRRIQWYRRFPMARWIGQYFSCKLIKTVDLPGNRNYIFGCHPHGVAATSYAITFAMESNGVSEKFPELIITPVTLQCYFWFPMQREIIMATGACPCTRESIDYILRQNKTGGRGVAIVVGGASEMVNTEPGRMRLILKNRKGFVRLALRNGASLVPVIGFGENELFPFKSIPDWKPWQKLPLPIQEFLRMIRFFFYILFHCKQLIPDRKPLTVVVGKPIEIEKLNDEPSQEIIDKYHQIYLDELRKLYDGHKDNYGYGKISIEIL